MKPEEIRKLNKTIKMVKQVQLIKQIQQLQKLNKILKQIKDAKSQQDVIKEFAAENKDDFWREKKPTQSELEMMREQTGYDKKVWADIVRELLGEPPTKEEK